jgi:hypothetical protein
MEALCVQSEGNMESNIERIAARWVLGLISGADLSAIATQALVDGHDGSALRELAGTTDTTLRDSTGLFEQALNELHAPRPSRKEAAFILARFYAAGILDGSLSPYQGAKAIWTKLSYEIRPDDHTLDAFIYWADEFEETDEPQRRSLCEAAIIEGAHELVDVPPSTSTTDTPSPQKK